MERKFYTDELEDLLKESADEFKMYPSKKVWQGLYNDLHPGRRWPSLGVTLALIFGLITISHLNTQQLRQPVFIEKHVSPKSYFNSSNGNSSNLSNTLVSSGFNIQDQSTNLLSQQKSLKSIPVIEENASLQKLSYYDYDNDNDVFTFNTDQLLISGVMSGEKRSEKPEFLLPYVVGQFQQPTIESLQSNSSSEYQTVYINNLPVSLSSNSISDRLLLNGKIIGNNDITIVADKEARGNSVLNKGVSMKKTRTSKVRWMYSIAPTVSYRKYTSSESPDANLVLSGLLNVLPGYDVNRKISHHSSSGLEAGVTMKYPLNKYLKFTSAFQVNYSSYIIEANTIHPMMATLLLKDQSRPFLYSSISYYGNGPGVTPVNLRNYAVNISIPVGLEYQIGGNDKVKFAIAATAQPVLALTTKSYILSTDNKNYLTNPSMARQWNMATNIGAFMSINSKKINWQLGPQVNYQILSSYSDKYPVKEHYVNYGIKLALGKK